MFQIVVIDMIRFLIRLLPNPAWLWTRHVRVVGCGDPYDMFGCLANMGCFQSKQSSALPEDDTFLKEQSANSKKIDREIERDRQISERG